MRVNDAQPGNTFYLAGPMTGLPDFNYPAFHDAARALRDAGLRIINPAEAYGGRADKDRTVYMRAGIENVLAADGVITLPGWDESPGARLEVQVAAAVGLPVCEYADGAVREVPGIVVGTALAGTAQTAPPAQAPHDITVYRDGVTVGGAQIQYARLADLDVECEVVMNDQTVTLHAVLYVPAASLRKVAGPMPGGADR